MSFAEVRSMHNKKSKKLNLAMLVSNGEVEKVFEQEDTTAKEVKEIVKADGLVADVVADMIGVSTKTNDYYEETKNETKPVKVDSQP